MTKFPFKTLPVLIHVPKTGGTSLRGIVMDNYEKDEVVLNYSVPLPKLKEKITPKTRIIMGHTYYGLEQYVPGYKFRYYAMIRHPIDRAVSYFWHIKREAKHPMHQYVKDMTLLEFTDTSHRNLDHKNRQVRTYLHELCDGQVQRLLGGGVSLAKTTTQQVMGQLRRQMQYNLHVGIFERMEDFKRLLCWHGVLHNPDGIKRGVAPHRPKVEDLTAEEREAIMCNNKLDLEFYEFVKKKYWSSL